MPDTKHLRLCSSMHHHYACFGIVVLAAWLNNAAGVCLLDVKQAAKHVLVA